MPILVGGYTPPDQGGSGDGYQITLPLSELESRSGEDTFTKPVSLDGREYMIDLTSGRYRRSSVDVLKTKSNATPNENLLLEPEVWRVARHTMHEGAGQSERDKEDSSSARFFASRNIDPWDKWRLTLLKGTSLVAASTETNLTCITVQAGLFLLNGSTLSLYSAWDSAPLSVTLLEPPLAWTTNGVVLYLAYESGLVTRLDPSSMTEETFVTLPGTPGLVEHVKGLVVASVGGALYDVSSGVADDTTKFYEHPVAGHTWVAGTDGLAAGYLLGGQGDRWMVYWLAVTDDGSSFSAPVVAAPLPSGEIGTSLGSYLGNVLIGTSGGVRFASPSGDNTLVYGRLIRTGSTVHSFAGSDRFVWFGIGGATPDDTTLAQQEAGLARMDLSTFTAELTPAYATDLTADVDSSVSSVAILDGRLMFTVPGVGLYAESDDYASEGWLRDGFISMGVEDQKMALYMNMVTLPLAGSIEVFGSFDGGADQVQLLTLEGEGSVTSGNHYIGRAFRTMDTIMYLRPGVSGAPVITYAELRAVPVTGAAHQWEVPLLIASATTWENSVQGPDVVGDLDVVLQLVESGRLFNFREGRRREACYATKYEWYPTSITGGSSEWQGVCVVTLRSVR